MVFPHTLEIIFILNSDYLLILSINDTSRSPKYAMSPKTKMTPRIVQSPLYNGVKSINVNQSRKNRFIYLRFCTTSVRYPYLIHNVYIDSIKFLLVIYRTKVTAICFLKNRYKRAFLQINICKKV